MKTLIDWFALIAMLPELRCGLVEKEMEGIFTQREAIRMRSR